MGRAVLVVVVVVGTLGLFWAYERNLSTSPPSPPPEGSGSGSGSGWGAGLDTEQARETSMLKCYAHMDQGRNQIICPLPRDAVQSCFMVHAPPCNTYTQTHRTRST